MLGTLIKDVVCEICGEKLDFVYEETFNAFRESADLTYLHIMETVDSIVDRYLVFKCYGCDTKYRYTYKDIDKIIRNTIFKNLLLLLTQDQMAMNGVNRASVIIYCGKCTGYDGQGSCPPNVFNKCDIKKFPSR